MAIPHAAAGQPFDVRPLGDTLKTTPTSALFKSRDLEVFRLVLTAGRSLPTHKVDGEITIQCLEGSLTVDVDGSSRPMAAGELMYLSGGALHAVTALSDASALVTVALKRG